MPTTSDPVRPGAFAKGYDSRRFGGGRSPVPRVTLPDGKKRTLSELAREATADSVGVLHKCVNDEAEDMSTRIRAAGYLLSLGWGAAPREVGLRLLPDDRTMGQLSEAELLAFVLPSLEKAKAAPITVEAEAAIPVESPDGR